MPSVTRHLQGIDVGPDEPEILQPFSVSLSINKRKAAPLEKMRLAFS